MEKLTDEQYDKYKETWATSYKAMNLEDESYKSGRAGTEEAAPSKKKKKQKQKQDAEAEPEDEDKGKDEDDKKQ